MTLRQQVGKLDKNIDRQTKPFGQPSGLGLADLAFAVQDLRNDALRAESVCSNL